MDPSSDGLLSVASQEEKQPASDPFAALGGSIGLMVWFVTQPLPRLLARGRGDKIMRRRIDACRAMRNGAPKGKGREPQKSAVQGDREELLAAAEVPTKSEKGREMFFFLKIIFLNQFLPLFLFSLPSGGEREREREKGKGKKRGGRRRRREKEKREERQGRVRGEGGRGKREEKERKW